MIFGDNSVLTFYHCDRAIIKRDNDDLHEETYIYGIIYFLNLSSYVLFKRKLIPSFLYFIFFWMQKNCNPFPSGIPGIINKEMPVKSGLFSDEIVKTLAPFEFEMNSTGAGFFLQHRN